MGSSEMISLVYVSSAKRLLTDQQLLDLLKLSRENNIQLGITGMLLYKDGNFMQVLEGPEERVRKLYHKISQDPRHGGVLKLLEQPIEERAFSKWSMAFRNLDQVTPDQAPGYSQFLNEPLVSETFRQNPTNAQMLLLVFRDNM